MSDMKCPFCQKELNQNNPQSIECRNDDCKKSYFMYGSKELWQELIRTRKALKIASDCMKIMYDNLPDGNRWKWEIEKTLEQIKITMQEQPNDN